MKLSNAPTGDVCRSWIGWQVLDDSGWPLGAVAFLWARKQTGTVRFLGIPTAWVSAWDLLVPVEGVTVDERQGLLRVPCSCAWVHQAPRLLVGAALTPEREHELCLHYGVGAHGSLEPRRWETPGANVTNYFQNKTLHPGACALRSVQDNRPYRNGF
jgi:hypothetical protein